MELSCVARRAQTSDSLSFVSAVSVACSSVVLISDNLTLSYLSVEWSPLYRRREREEREGGGKGEGEGKGEGGGGEEEERGGGGGGGKKRYGFCEFLFLGL